MYFDPDAPVFPGQPDFSKGCNQDVMDDTPLSSVAVPPMHPEHQQQDAPSSLESVSSAPLLSAPAAGWLSSSPSLLLTSLSPALSVLYLLLAALLLASFYWLPNKPTRSSKQRDADTQRRQAAAVTQLLAAMPSASSALSSSSEQPYRKHAASIPPSLSSHFSPEELQQAIRVIAAAFDEDIGSGDVSTLATVPVSSSSSARFLAKEAGVVSGCRVVELAFHMFDPELRTSWTVQDGQRVAAGTVLGTVTGSSRSLLTAERLALNLMQRMSGIATATAALVAEIAAVGSSSILLDTRKTAPGLRLLDKAAVRHGGGSNHRVGLYDMVMVKDNHITAAGGIRQAVQQVRQWCAREGRTLPVEVETRTLDEVRQLLACIAEQTDERKAADDGKDSQPQPSVRVTRVMLDNMVKLRRDQHGTLQSVDVSLLREAVELLRADVRGRELESEASGNVTAETIGRIAETGVTFISVGAITHSVMALDISLKIQ